jgi:ABC-type phosphate transport system substrate-binding protein
VKKTVNLVTKLLAITIVTAMISLIGVSRVHAGGDPIVVIVNGSNPVDNLTMDDLRKIFLSQRSRWESGRQVVAVMVGEGIPERTAFLKVVCGMSDADFGKYLLQAAFSGKAATYPKEVLSSRRVILVVANSPGAIGFVKAGDLRGEDNDGLVKPVKIDSIAASETGYKLHM